jgi:SET domain-containing protein
MYLVKTYLDKSPIHGIGVYAGGDFPAGTVLWREQPGFDAVLTPEQVRALPAEARAFMDTYSYYAHGKFHLNADNGKFTNHADNPNSRMNDKGEMYAVRAIKKGEEITADYDDFAEDRPEGVLAGN